MGRIDHLLLVGLGGAGGALLRWLIADSWSATTFPWPTLIVNVLGCGLLALVTAHGIPVGTQRLLGAGFCGGLTTFSTLSVEVVQLLDDEQSATAIGYVSASVVLGVAAFVVMRSISPQPPTFEPDEVSP